MAAKDFTVLHYDGKGLTPALIELPALDDPNLTWREKGFLAYIRTRAVLSRENLVSMSMDGESSIRTITKSLINKGYAVRVKAYDEAGKILKWFFVSFPAPTELTKGIFDEITEAI